MADDPHFDSVVLLYDMDGADEATDITDASNSGHVETFVGAAQLDTEFKKFGTASLGPFPDGARVSIPDSTDWHLAPVATDKWTVEFHVRHISLPTSGNQMTHMAQYHNTFNKRAFAFHLNENTGDPVFRVSSYSDGGSTPTVDLRVKPAGGINTGQWYHVAFSSDGTVVRGFVDGVELGDELAASIFNSNQPLDIGAIQVTSNYVNELDGHLDNIRITKGVARYTANFTPPTTAFPAELGGAPSDARARLTQLGRRI